MARMENTKFSSYDEVLDFLYTQLPMFQRVGASAFKKDLTNTLRLCEFLEHPQHQFKSVHVAGTNGKGSSSHFLAATLQSAGYKTGLYTSPHLKSFTERIKINGQEIPEREVVDFINKVHPVINEIQPSFFELTVAVAFDYFAAQQVDIAIVEVGMGGRLDSTNVVIPEVSLITNISEDHQQWLGETLPLIAAEKAGIIKDNIPVVISERQSDDITSVFIGKAKETSSSIAFASDEYQGELQQGELTIENDNTIYKLNPPFKGSYLVQNLVGVIKTIDILNERGFTISSEDILRGVEKVTELTNCKVCHRPLKFVSSVTFYTPRLI
ncbi:MAG: Mur ligase family protein [Bacteroidota bacterium]